MWRRGAEMVAAILRGAKPANMPMEVPASFELAVNLATARKLGVAVPQSMLLRADRVIE
jgi:putative ABC transport system substrate-binding protein